MILNTCTVSSGSASRVFIAVKAPRQSPFALARALAAAILQPQSDNLDCQIVRCHPIVKRHHAENTQAIGEAALFRPELRRPAGRTARLAENGFRAGGQP